MLIISNFFSIKLIKKIYKNNLLVVLSIIFVRFFYVIYTNNETGDLTFYNKIADGLLNGCGIGTISQEGDCSHVVGHFFPGFFYLIALSHKLGFGIKGLVILISLLQFSSYLYLSSIIKKFTGDFELAKSILLITSLSPLTLGWSRQILMEPLISTIGVFYLANVLKIFFEGFSNRKFAFLLGLQILGIYIKPTSILLIIPFVVLCFNKLRFPKFLITFLLYSSLIFILILPWGIRNISLGSNALFTSANSSNFYPKNGVGYSKWLKSWVVTEHEQAQNGFPVWRDPMNLNIQKSRFNPFIDQNEILRVNKQYKLKERFSKEDDVYFEKLTKERIKELGFEGNFFLYSSKIISLLINPLNSWGWPLELKEYVSINNLNLDKSIFYRFMDKKILFNLSLKILLFFYRLIFFSFFFSQLIHRFKKYKFSILKINSLDGFLSVASFFYLLGLLYLFTIKYPALEHRYLSIVIPWLEVTSRIYFDKSKDNYLKN